MELGAVLHLPESRIEHVYFPISGMISIVVVMCTGEQIETAIVGREGVAGASIAMLGSRSFGQAVVQIQGRALRVSGRNFMAFYNSSISFHSAINKYQGFLLAQTQQSVGCHAVHSVNERLCRWILQSRDVLHSDSIKLTQEFLSHMLGVQRNSVGACAQNLQKAGLIKYSRGTIKILDGDALEQQACECYRAIRRLTKT